MGLVNTIWGGGGFGGVENERFRKRSCVKGGIEDSSECG